MARAFRLYSNGTVNVARLDEISAVGIRLKETDFYADEFDEVTSITVPFRAFANGKIIIQGSFDDDTSVV